MFGANYFGQIYPGEPYGVTGILFDNASSSGYEATLSTYNWSHTTALSSMVLIVDVSIFATGTVSSITYNGVNLIFIRADVQGVYRNEMWYLSKPTYGANTVTVNLSTSLTSIASASSYANVFTDDPIEANAGNIGSGISTPSVNITTISDGAYVVDGISTSNTSMSPAASQTKRALNSGALGTGATSDKPFPTAGATSTSWSAVGVTDSWALGVLSLAPYTAKLLEKAFTATLSFSGSFAKTILRTLIAALSFTGSFSKQTRRVLSGGLSFMGAMTRFISYPLTSALSFGGSMIKLTSRTLTGALSFTGSFSKSPVKNLVASLSFSGNIIKTALKQSSAALNFSGKLNYLTSHNLIAALSFAGSLSKTIPRNLTASLSFIGNLATTYIPGVGAAHQFLRTLMGMGK